MWTNDLYKGFDGNWLASSSAMLDDDKRLKVITTKGRDGSIRSSAYVFMTEPCGFESHRMVGDFAAVLITNKARATESAVKRQHEEAMDKAGDIISRAMDFYRSKAA